MRIDKPREHDAIAEVELFGFSRESMAFYFLALANRDDALVLDKQRAVAHDSKVGERFSSARRRPSEGQ